MSLWARVGERYPTLGTRELMSVIFLKIRSITKCLRQPEESSVQHPGHQTEVLAEDEHLHDLSVHHRRHQSPPRQRQQEVPGRAPVNTDDQCRYGITKHE